MPFPLVHEPAVCVFKDSLIFCIGGSASSFAVPTNIVRIYNPSYDTWRTSNNFPITTTTGHAECKTEDSSIVVAGGYGASFINVIYHGYIDHYIDSTGDSTFVTWRAVAINDTTIFRTGVYRVGGGKAGEWMLFGPALRNSSTYNTIYSVGFENINDTLKMYWYRLIPNVPDSAGNRPTIAVNMTSDSAHLYLFAGSRGFTVVNTSYRYSFALPPPIGVKQISNNVPDKFILYQNYPNPFNPVTIIKFALPPSPKGEGLGVRVVVYDILGREITTLVNEQLKPGAYEVTWDGTNYPSGVYFYQLRVVETSRRDVFTETRKMVLLK
jgi:hypothetical protein